MLSDIPTLKKSKNTLQQIIFTDGKYTLKSNIYGLEITEKSNKIINLCFDKKGKFGVYSINDELKQGTYNPGDFTEIVRIAPEILTINRKTGQFSLLGFNNVKNCYLFETMAPDKVNFDFYDISEDEFFHAKDENGFKIRIANESNERLKVLMYEKDEVSMKVMLGSVNKLTVRAKNGVQSSNILISKEDADKWNEVIRQIAVSPLKLTLPATISVLDDFVL